MHGFGNGQDQAAVERWFVEDLIDIATGAMYLSRQPVCAALVGLHLLPDNVSDMDFAIVDIHCPVIWASAPSFVTTK